MLKEDYYRSIELAICFVVLVLGFGASTISKAFPTELLNRVSLSMYALSAVIAFLMLTGFLIHHKIYKGVKYFWYHWRTISLLQSQLIDAGFAIDRGSYIELPRIKLSLEKYLMSGTLEVTNAIRYDKKLDDVVLSSGLGNFVVETHHITDDANTYIYELVDGSVSYKMTFKSLDEFLKYSNTIDLYKLSLDKRTSTKLQSNLIVGQTGSGKTYALYSLILQMLNKPIPYHIYFADPKGSSLSIIGNAVCKDKTAENFEKICSLLEIFVSEMRTRKTELQERLHEKVDADYTDFGLSPHIFIFDEYASFASVLSAQKKEIRDSVKSMLYEIILQGRQLGCFLFIVMQKSDATLIDTALRDNLPLKIVLGNAEQQTYITAFGNGADIPNRHYLIGEGVFTEPTLAPSPKLVQFPHLDFDILTACKGRTPVM